MPTEFTLNIKRDGDWFVGQCAEVPEANGQGRTLQSCTRSLALAIAQILDEQHPPTHTSATVEVSVGNRPRSFNVELTHSWEGVSIGCPALPGCFSEGDDATEALENIHDAISDYLEVSQENKLRKVSLPEVA